MTTALSYNRGCTIAQAHGPCGGLQAKAGLLPVEWVMKLISKKKKTIAQWLRRSLFVPAFAKLENTRQFTAVASVKDAPTRKP